MKVNSLNNRDISFNGFYNSNALKKTLAFAENNGALFMSATSLALSAFARPFSILAAPKTDKENKKIACAKSITSTILDFAITFAISIPIVGAIKAISKNPQKYLKQETIKNFTEGFNSLDKSKSYTFANQMFKLSIGIALAAPKAILNVTGIPYIMNSVFKNNNSKTINQSGPSFKGQKENKLSKLMGKLFDSKKMQEYSKKNQNSNYPMHIAALKDTLTTCVFMSGVYHSKKINEERKGPLIYNSFISTALSIATAYCVDGLTSGFDKKIIQKIAENNKNDINLKKYIDGYKIAKPTLLMGIIYYIIIPLFS